MSHPYPYQAVLFDMDGVVVDNMRLHRAIWREFAEGCGVHPTEAELRALDGRRAVDIIAALFGEGKPDAEVAEMSRARETLYHSRLATATLDPVPGVIDYLKALGALGVPRVLATSAVPVNVEAVMSRLGIAGLFEAIVTAVDVTHGKPHPEIYLMAAGKVGADPTRCLVVEDALPGVMAGKAAGATCLGLMTSEGAEALERAGADLVAPHFEALPAPLIPARS